MARTPGDDDRQDDFFGAPAAVPKSPAATLSRKRRVSPSSTEDAPEDEDINIRVARLSPVELRTLVTDLPDDILAQLTLVTIRQLKRRLARDSQRSGKGRASVLERAAQQLIAEFSEPSEDEYDF